mgnify:CR=1 FL=1
MDASPAHRTGKRKEAPVAARSVDDVGKRTRVEDADALEVMSDDERRKLVSTQSSLSMPDEPRLPSSIAGLENFSLTRDEDEAAQPDVDAESFFNLPDSDDEDDSER